MQNIRHSFQPAIGLFVIFTCLPFATAEERLIIVERGELPVLITAPHGGTTLIPGVPVRESRDGDRVNLRRDELTNELAIATADEVEKLVGKRPTLIVAEFSRQSLDANRPETLAYQHEAAAKYYRDYHAAVATAVQDIRNRWQQGLLLDMHAQWLRPQAIMRGTRDGQTVQGLDKRRGWEGLLGAESLLGSLEQAGVTLFPPPGESEGEWTHAGSYTVTTYGKDGIDGVQLEIGSDLCDTKQDVERLAGLIAKGIRLHLAAEQQLPVAEEQTTLTAVDEPGVADEPTESDNSDSGLTEAEQAFVDLLSNAVLVGRFSIDGIENANANPERYKINKVTKIRGKHWSIEAQITYGKVDVAVPVPVEVHWADDTPVISLTDLQIPGLGEGFTTRVLFYEDRYAGSWYHGKIGGHMWGKIEKSNADGTDEPATPDTE